MSSSHPKKFPCPVCGDLCPVKLTKKEKPCYICNECGVQVFIRGIDGIRKFANFKDSDLLKALKSKSSIFLATLTNKFKEIEFTKLKIEKLNEGLPLLGDSKIENRIAELKTELEKLEYEYIQQLTN